MSHPSHPIPSHTHAAQGILGLMSCQSNQEIMVLVALAVDNISRESKARKSVQFNSRPQQPRTEPHLTSTIVKVAADDKQIGYCKLHIPSQPRWRQLFLSYSQTPASTHGTYCCSLLHCLIAVQQPHRLCRGQTAKTPAYITVTAPVHR